MKELIKDLSTWVCT